MGTACRHIMPESLSLIKSCERQITELTAFTDWGGFKVSGIFKDTASGTKPNHLARNHIIELAQVQKTMPFWSQSSGDGGAPLKIFWRHLIDFRRTRKNP